MEYLGTSLTPHFTPTFASPKRSPAIHRRITAEFGSFLTFWEVFRKFEQLCRMLSENSYNLFFPPHPAQLRNSSLDFSLTQIGSAKHREAMRAEARIAPPSARG